MNLLLINFSHILRILYYLILHSKDCLKLEINNNYIFNFIDNLFIYFSTK